MAGYVRGGWSSQLEVFLAPAENGTCLRAVLVVIGSNCRLYSGEVVRSIGGGTWAAYPPPTLPA